MQRVCDFLIDNINYLVKTTDYENLLEECIKREILTASTLADMEELPSIADRHRLLFFKITHDEEHIKELLNILEVHFKLPIAKLIESNMNALSLEDGLSFDTDGTAMSTFTNAESNNSLQLYTEPVENIKKIVVKKAKTYRSSDNSQCYPMRSGNFYLLFVNIFDFKDERKFRNGAAVDKANIITLYRKLSFKIQYHENLSLKEFHKLIDELVQSKVLVPIECFKLIILSHGCSQNNLQMIEFSCGKICSVECILDKFNNIDCVDLRGKPKIFIFPGCRSLTAEEVQLERTPITIRRSDMKICYAAAKGGDTYRDAINGTWYIANFVHVMAEHAHKHHFDDLVKMVGRRLVDFCAKRSFEENGEFLQTSSNEDIGFNKKVFFNPGYYESNNDS